MADYLSEFDLIARYLRPLAHDPDAFNLQDDIAKISVPDDKHLIASKDMLVSGTHFFTNDAPALIAQKALRSNISDIVSKGAQPIRYMLGFAFPVPPTVEFIGGFTNGLEKDQKRYEISLLGGDITRSKSDFVVSVTMFGMCDKRGPATRLGAQAGDSIYVTGTLGNAALGLKERLQPDLFNTIDNETLLSIRSAYLLPDPPLAIASAIQSFATASMDISDGLFSDLKHLCTSSNVSAEIAVSLIPLDEKVRSLGEENPVLLECALKGGDDYQCLMSIPASDEASFEASARSCGIVVTKIGEIVPKRRQLITIVGKSSIDCSRLGGYIHF